jgi:hypothetical protein
MDTREKIATVDSVMRFAKNGKWLAVAGRFDPLTLVQAQRIAAISQPDRKLLAVVLPAADTLLPAEARAALVAGLREVDAVVIANPNEIAQPGLPIDYDSGAEQKRSIEFVEFVLARQRTVAAVSGSRP